MANDFRLAPLETKFAELIWANEAITSPELVKLCELELKWKKSTTYTVLKKLCDKGVFRNENAVVTAVVSKEEFYAQQSRRYVEDAFGGSLPKFLASFMGGGTLSRKQANELKRLIDEFGEGLKRWTKYF